LRYKNAAAIAFSSGSCLSCPTDICWR